MQVCTIAKNNIKISAIVRIIKTTKRNTSCRLPLPLPNKLAYLIFGHSLRLLCVLHSTQRRATLARTSLEFPTGSSFPLAFIRGRGGGRRRRIRRHLHILVVCSAALGAGGCDLPSFFGELAKPFRRPDADPLSGQHVPFVDDCWTCFRFHCFGMCVCFSSFKNSDLLLEPQPWD